MIEDDNWEVLSSLTSLDERDVRVGRRRDGRIENGLAVLHHAHCIRRLRFYKRIYKLETDLGLKNSNGSIFMQLIFQVACGH
jgi:hypothetical protein